MIPLRQSTAVDIEIGPFIDTTDFVSVMTSLTLNQSDCLLMKNGGAAAQKNDATAATHRGGGHYSVPLNATDTGTLGRLRLIINEGGAVPMWRDFVVLPQQVYDSLFAGSDRLQVHVDEITAALITATALADGAITAAKVATNAIDADALAADAVAEIQSGLATAAALATVSAYVDELEGRLTAARAGYLDYLSGGAVATAAALALVAGYIDTEVAAILAAVDTEVAAIKAKTDALPSDPADDSDIDAQLATIASYLDTEVAAILAAVDTEVAAIKAKTDALPASPAAVGSAMTLADGAITSAKFASGAITAGVIAADAIGASELGADAVAEIQSGLATAASIAALNNLSAAQVNAEVVDALSVDTYAEPGSVPGATSSLAAKLSWLFTLARNRHITTATQDRVRNDADSADIGVSALGDDGVSFSRGKYS